LQQPPKLSYLERKRMKNNMQMTLATLQHEEEKTQVVEKQIASQLIKQEEAEKVLKKDVFN
jgi:hypothetical protein